MPTPSKFTAEVQAKVLEAAQVGASQRTQAAYAGISHGTLQRWLEQGKTATEGSRFAEFAKAHAEAEAHPRMRALGVVYRDLPDNAALAWKFIERREPGYAPPLPNMTATQTGPVIIQLALADGRTPVLPGAEVIEGEVVDEQDSLPGADPTTSA